MLQQHDIHHLQQELSEVHFSIFLLLLELPSVLTFLLQVPLTNKKKHFYEYMGLENIHTPTTEGIANSGNSGGEGVEWLI